MGDLLWRLCCLLLLASRATGLTPGRPPPPGGLQDQIEQSSNLQKKIDSLDSTNKRSIEDLKTSQQASQGLGPGSNLVSKPIGVVPSDTGTINGEAKSNSRRVAKSRRIVKKRRVTKRKSKKSSSSSSSSKRRTLRLTSARLVPNFNRPSSRAEEVASRSLPLKNPINSNNSLGLPFNKLTSALDNNSTNVKGALTPILPASFVNGSVLPLSPGCTNSSSLLSDPVQNVTRAIYNQSRPIHAKKSKFFLIREPVTNEKISGRAKSFAGAPTVLLSKLSRFSSSKRSSSQTSSSSTKHVIDEIIVHESDAEFQKKKSSPIRISGGPRFFLIRDPPKSNNTMKTESVVKPKLVPRRIVSKTSTTSKSSSSTNSSSTENSSSFKQILKSGGLKTQENLGDSGIATSSPQKSNSVGLVQEEFKPSTINNQEPIKKIGSSVSTNNLSGSNKFRDLMNSKGDISRPEERDLVPLSGIGMSVNDGQLKASSNVSKIRRRKTKKMRKTRRKSSRKTVKKETKSSSRSLISNHKTNGEILPLS